MILQEFILFHHYIFAHNNQIWKSSLQPFLCLHTMLLSMNNERGVLKNLGMASQEGTKLGASSKFEPKNT